MPDHDADLQSAGPFIVVAINNTNTSIGLADGLSVTRVTTVPSSEPESIGNVAASMLDTDPAIVLLASVNAAATEPAVRSIRAATGLDVRRFGPDMPVPIAHTIPEPVTTGLDRFLVALGAFETIHQACIVVDAGTALTCDFVDGQGVFHGGAIIPGGQMMLDALPAKAPALPRLNLADMPSPLEPFGKSTEHAMLLGVQAAARGAVRYLAERYAEFYEAYPQIIATGGSAELLFEGDELIENVVPHLQLVGIAAARKRLIEADDGQS
ncbi:MAG: type III pantothenate kinase [Phycisphaerales bacterium]|nr:type III pantothenate kinase [Phycisphaerales bacterium]MCB9836900.1 type III pantothenate kinase [Phycisphaera sp.]